MEEAQRLLQEGVEMPASRWGTPWMSGSLLPPYVGTAVISGEAQRVSVSVPVSCPVETPPLVSNKYGIVPYDQCLTFSRSTHYNLRPGPLPVPRAVFLPAGA